MLDKKLEKYIKELEKSVKELRTKKYIDDIKKLVGLSDANLLMDIIDDLKKMLEAR